MKRKREYREEFSAETKRQALKRANGHCEKCPAPLVEGQYRFDHRLPCAFGGRATLDNCVVQCLPCDRIKTYKHDIPDIARSNRIRKAHATHNDIMSAKEPGQPRKRKGTIPGRPFNSKGRRKFNRDAVVPRDTMRTVVKAYQP